MVGPDDYTDHIIVADLLFDRSIVAFQRQSVVLQIHGDYAMRDEFVSILIGNDLSDPYQTHLVVRDAFHYRQCIGRI